MRSICRKGTATLAAALALCAVASASAAAAPQWYVAGKALSGSSKLAEATKVEENIELSVPGLKLVITCTGVKLGSSEIVSPSSLKSKGMELEGCKTTTPATGCEIAEPEIYFATLEAAVSKAPEDWLTFKTTASELASFEFSGSDTCAFQGFGVVKGTFTLAVPKGQEELAEQVFAGLGTGESPSALTVGGQKAYLTGKLAAKLTAGSKWSLQGTEKEKEEEKKAEPGTWYEGGKALSGSSKLAEATKVEENVKLSSPALGLVITCTGVKLGSSEIVSPSSLKSKGMELEGCKTTTPATGCEIAEPEIYFSALEGAVKKSASPEDRITFKTTALQLASFEFSGSDTCSFEGFGVLKGTFTFAMPKGQEELAEQVFAGLGTSESPSALTLGGQKAYLTGRLAAKLTSAAKWSSH